MVVLTAVACLQSGNMSESRKRQLSRRAAGKGMSLPFQPLNLAFVHMYYSVDMPAVSPGPSH